MAVLFYPEEHKYVSVDDDKFHWTSVSTLVGKVKTPFDQIAQSEKASKNKKSKWYGIPPEEIRAIWKAEGKRSTDLGTWYHEKQERALYASGTVVAPSGKLLPVVKSPEQDGIKLAGSQKLTEGVYPEHLFYLKSTSICGQSDLVTVHDGLLNISDHKSNKEIKRNGFVSWDGKVSRMLSPVGHLEDCHFSHYALQLSLYMYMGLRHNPGLLPGKLIIHHVKFEQEAEDKFGYPIYKLDENNEPIVKEVEDIELPYLKNEVISLLEWHKKQK